MTQHAFDHWLDQTAPEWSGLCVYLPDVLERDQRQPEKTVPLWDYIPRVLSDTRIAQGYRMAAQWGDDLAQLETRFPVSRYVLLAIWGLETNYGATRGDYHVPSALATLAYGSKNPRRRDIFLEQLRSLTDIATQAHQTLRGSWAGAMGHTQFMPTAYRDYATAFDGVAAADIWGDDPRDALASTARYLAEHGAVSGVDDVIIAELETDFDYSTLDELIIGDGRWGLHIGCKYRAIAPYGSHGPAVFLGPNAQAIHAYNHSLHYVLAVTFLARALAGMDVPDVQWPVALTILSNDQLRDVQAGLVGLGYNTNGVDGIWGSGSVRALRDWQASVGRIADGYPTTEEWFRLTGCGDWP